MNMPSDTADQHWDDQWKNIQSDSKWLVPEPDVTAWAETFDHVLSWNVIYHGDEDILLRTIGEIRRVLKPGGTYLGTMLSKRRLPFEQAKYKGGREIGRNAWVFDAPGTDKIHPHYFCSAAEMLALFNGFETLWLEDHEHDAPGSWHWHLIMERL